MQLPSTLQWIEADLPDILAYKAERLAGDKPACQLERVAVNLADLEARRRFLASVVSRGKRGVVLTEGLVIYLTAEEVAAFARDLCGAACFERWILDLHSPRLLKMMQRRTGKALEKVGASFQFGPAEGPSFFAPLGWKLIQIEGLLDTAARFGRPPFIARLFAKLFDTRNWHGKRPWSGICLFQKTPPSGSERENRS